MGKTAPMHLSSDERTKGHTQRNKGHFSLPPFLFPKSILDFMSVS